MGNTARSNRRPLVSLAHAPAAAGATAVALLAFLLASCATTPTDLSHVAFGPLPPAVTGLLDDGPWRVDVIEGSIQSEYGCTVVFERYLPRAASSTSRGASARPLVVLAHGFMRDLTRMRGWAMHWASHGVETIVPSFCNTRLFRGNHDRNADDMVALAQREAEPNRPIIYAGYSAGGLSALLASVADERTIAYLGFDPVNSGGTAGEIGVLPAPALYLYGEPDRCNAENNMRLVMPSSPRRVALRARYATHCSFEDPTDNRCTRLCGEIVPEDMEREVRNSIRAVADAWVFEHAGILPAGMFSDALVTELVTAGRIEVVPSAPGPTGG